MSLSAGLFSKIFESRRQNADRQLVVAVRLGRASKPSFSGNKLRSNVEGLAVPQYVGKAACQMPAAAFARAAGGRSTMAAARGLIARSACQRSRFTLVFSVHATAGARQLNATMLQMQSTVGATVTKR